MLDKEMIIMEPTKHEQQAMKLLNLTYEELQAEELRIRLEAVVKQAVVFVEPQDKGK